MEPFSLALAAAAKVKASAAAVHMHGLMLDLHPPLCENVQHGEITCADSDLPKHEWCKPCKEHYA